MMNLCRGIHIYYFNYVIPSEMIVFLLFFSLFQKQKLSIAIMVFPDKDKMTNILIVCFCIVSCVPNLASFSGMSIIDCLHGYSLTFICLVSCVPNVASFSGMSIIDCLYGYSLTFICLVSCVPNVASFSGMSIID